jgi:hypothetical protein
VGFSVITCLVTGVTDGVAEAAGIATDDGVAVGDDVQAAPKIMISISAIYH